MKDKLIILDRDGVINHESLEYIKSEDEFIPIEGSLEAIAKLNNAGYKVIIATNQSGVARGLYTLETLSKIHRKLKHELNKINGEIAEIFYCPHHPDDNCDCRKPKLGMFKKIQQQFNNDLSEVYFIGDSKTDIKAALDLPCKPILVLTGKGQQTLNDNPELAEILNFTDLAEAVDYILSAEKA